MAKISKKIAVEEVIPKQAIPVAIAVIFYKKQFLLGFRNAEQHQGNRYEFVGGKIEADETAQQALIREVYEELGLALDKNNTMTFMGVIEHQYDMPNDMPSHEQIQTDTAKQRVKKVSLYVYSVMLTDEQFALFATRTQGKEGQQIQWVSQDDLLANRYPLPDANQQILAWIGSTL